MDTDFRSSHIFHAPGRANCHAHYIPQIYQHFDEKEYSKQIIHEVEQEVDEIEAELDTVFNNDKVTPIWEIPTKKK